MQLHFEERGQGHTGTVPHLILHGLFGSLVNWRTFAKRMAEHLHVVSVDLRNHGRSPHDEQHDYPVLAADVVELLERLGITRAHVLGHSMGGKAAMELALAYPKRVDHLVVVDIAPRGHAGADRAVLEALLSVDLASLRSRGDADAALASRLADRALRAFLLMGLVREGEGFRWRFNLDVLARAYDEITGPVPAAGPFDGPTLFVRGGRSTYLCAEDVPAIRERFPRAEVVTIESAGHWLHVEAADEFFSLVQDFLVRSPL